MIMLDQYEVTEEIAEGGFAKIFKARHKLLDEPACVKVNKDLTPDELSSLTPDEANMRKLQNVQLLRAEAKLLWRLGEYHSIPNAKGFYLINRHTAALVMSWIEGKTLEELVSKNSRMHPEDASWILERLLGALYYAHANGVVHSDVKPGNVMVEAKKHDIKLIDWGLSVYRPTSATRPVGSTPAYAAPELSEGKPPIPETDIYGAGMVLLYALGGEAAVLSKTFPGDVPKPLTEFGSSLIRYDPRERPNWEKQNLVERLSEIRQEAFGRRHTT